MGPMGKPFQQEALEPAHPVRPLGCFRGQLQVRAAGAPLLWWVEKEPESPKLNPKP